MNNAMTKRRRRLLAALAVLALLGVLALPAVHWRLIGWWRGEPFYQGRPASYWAAELRSSYRAVPIIPAFGVVQYRRVDDPWAWLKAPLGCDSIASFAPWCSSTTTTNDNPRPIPAL